MLNRDKPKSGIIKKSAHQFASRAATAKSTGSKPSPRRSAQRAKNGHLLRNGFKENEEASGDFLLAQEPKLLSVMAPIIVEEKKPRRSFSQSFKTPNGRTVRAVPVPRSAVLLNGSHLSTPHKQAATTVTNGVSRKVNGSNRNAATIPRATVSKRKLAPPLDIEPDVVVTDDKVDEHEDTEQAPTSSSVEGNNSKLLPAAKASWKLERRDRMRRKRQATGGQENFEEAKRKYFLVQNGDTPSELYCTDLISSAKVDRLGRQQYAAGADDEDSRTHYKPVAERWREDWNHGVQCPLGSGPVKYDFEVEQSALPRTKFTLPRKLVKREPKCYADKARFTEVRRPPVLHYQLDAGDIEWLVKANEKRKASHLPPISRSLFVAVMDELEGIHTQLIAPLCTMKTEKDEDAPCDVCGSTECEEEDEIVFCDGCNVSVHMSCYGIQSLPTNEWLCQACTLCYGKELKCELCPLKGGAMKCTKSGSFWVHVVCALWMPEARFDDVDLREPVSRLEDIPPDRWQFKCVICDTRKGACIQCSVDKCVVPFHVACAQRAGLTMKIDPDPTAESEVRMVSMCPRHSKNEKADVEETKPDKLKSEELRELERNFYQYADLRTICSKVRGDKVTVSDVMEYWKMKRLAGEGQALISEPFDITINVNGSEKRISAIGSTTVVPSAPLSGHLQRQWERFRKLRLNLEKARNLTYLVRRRERTKLELVKAERQSIQRAKKLVPVADNSGASAFEDLLSSLLGNLSGDAVEKDAKIRKQNTLVDTEIAPSTSKSPPSTIASRKRAYAAARDETVQHPEDSPPVAPKRDRPQPAETTSPKRRKAAENRSSESSEKTSPSPRKGQQRRAKPQPAQPPTRRPLPRDAKHIFESPPARSPRKSPAKAKPKVRSPTPDSRVLPLRSRKVKMQLTP